MIPVIPKYEKKSFNSIINLWNPQKFLIFHQIIPVGTLPFVFDTVKKLVLKVTSSAAKIQKIRIENNMSLISIVLKRTKLNENIATLNLNPFDK